MAKDHSFAPLRKLLDSHGWRLTRITGSHHIFTKAGELPISIPVHRGKVKAVYVRKVEKICRVEEGEAG